MLKLTLSHSRVADGLVFINPLLVTSVIPRAERDTVVGCFIGLGSHSEDGLIAVQEAAQAVAEHVADAVGRFGIVDVAAVEVERAERAKRHADAVRNCPGMECPGCPGCEVPF
jgi:hypothetical protein